MGRRYQYPFLLALTALASGTPAQQPSHPQEAREDCRQIQNTHNSFSERSSTQEIQADTEKHEPTANTHLQNNPAPVQAQTRRTFPRRPQDFELEDLLAYLDERDKNPSNVPRLFSNGDLVLLDGTPENTYQDAINAALQSDESIPTAVRRKKAQRDYGQREPWGLFVELRTTVDNMTAAEKLEYLKTGRGPPIVDFWIYGVMPKQNYLDRVMGAVFDSIGPKNPEIFNELARQDAKRNSDPIREPTTGGKNAPLTPEEEARLDEILAHAEPIRIVVPPITMPDGTTRSRFQSSPEYNEKIGREATQREIQQHGSAEQMIRMNRLRSRRDAETTIYGHERPRLLAHDDGIAAVQSLYTHAKEGDYEKFAAAIHNSVSNLPTRIVADDADFYKPFNEMKRRQLYETLRESTIEELCVSAPDTGLGQEVNLTTLLKNERQELKLVVRKEGIVGVTLDSAFDFYGRWDLPEYTALEIASQTLEQARKAAQEQNYDLFARNAQLGVTRQPIAPDAEQYNPEPITRGVLERFYNTLKGALGIKTEVWRGDHGEGIQLHVNLENGTQYIVAVRQDKIIGLSVYSGG